MGVGGGKLNLCLTLCWLEIIFLFILRDRISVFMFHYCCYIFRIVVNVTLFPFGKRVWLLLFVCDLCRFPLIFPVRVNLVYILVPLLILSFS